MDDHPYSSDQLNPAITRYENPHVLQKLRESKCIYYQPYKYFSITGESGVLNKVAPISASA